MQIWRLKHLEVHCWAFFVMCWLACSCISSMQQAGQAGCSALECKSVLITQSKNPFSMGNQDWHCSQPNRLVNSLLHQVLGIYRKQRIYFGNFGSLSLSPGAESLGKNACKHPTCKSEGVSHVGQCSLQHMTQDPAHCQLFRMKPKRAKN